MRGVATALSALAVFFAGSVHGIGFSARAGQLTVSAPGYRLTLSATNGRVLSLADASGTQLLHGSYGCLWGLNPNHHASMLGGCSFARTGARRFSYRWNAGAATLTLNYRAPTLGSVVVTLHAGASSFDLRLALVNRGPVRDEVRFPDGLAGDTRTVTAGYVPETLPGVKFAPAYFTHLDKWVQIYPSRWAFADYLALDVGKSGHVAVYTVNRGPIAPAQLGFIHLSAGSPCSGTTYCAVHEYETWVKTGASWTSPIVRVRVGADVQQSVLAYRDDNGIDAYPSLASKVGSSLGTLARAPLVKTDLQKTAPFTTLAADLAALPSPVLLHPVAYQPGGHDHNDPDFLPPAASAGTDADFRAFVDSAHANGDLVMPYANLSWWDPLSPTMRSAQPGAVAVIDQNGKPQTVNYGANAGVIVSPYAPAVKARTAREFEQWQTEVPVDCVFLDQIGARPWLRDFDPSSPTPLAYDDGWLALLAPYANRCLMAEDGWDRLARDFSAFHGGLLMLDRELGLPDVYFGAGNWQPFPIATWLFHDKVLMYQHDLYQGTLATDGEVLTWNMAFGLISSYEWTLGDETNPWLVLTALLQRDLGPHYAGVPLASYTTLAPSVTRSVFGDLTVDANLSATAYDGIAPDGFRATTADGSVVAGAFTGGSFSPGTHWLVEEHDATGTTVRQPIGADTPVTVKGTQVVALASDGSSLGPVAATVANGSVTFEVRSSVAAYRVTG